MFSINEKEAVKEEKIKDKKVNYKGLIIIGVIVVIALIVVYIAYNYYQNNYVYLKEDKSKDIVYTIYTRENNKKSSTEVPKINIKSKKIKAINNDIYKTMGKFLGKDTNASSYSYEINGDILSIVIEMIQYNDEYVADFKFKTYNIDLTTLEEVSDKYLLKLYGVDNKYVEETIKNHFKYYYKDELKKGYLDKNECDYNCFLELRTVDNYLDNVQYYISDGNLYVYKGFNVVSVYHEEDYYKEENFMFYITD